MATYLTLLRSMNGNGFRVYLKNSDPGQADVVERDGSLERVVSDGAARRVELVPVDAVVV